MADVDAVGELTGLLTGFCAFCDKGVLFSIDVNLV